MYIFHICKLPGIEFSTKISRKQMSDQVAKDRTRCGKSGCLNLGDKKCSRCGCIYYCSLACQREDWTQHKQECNPKNKSAKITKSSVCVKRQVVCGDSLTHIREILIAIADKRITKQSVEAELKLILTYCEDPSNYKILISPELKLIRFLVETFANHFSATEIQTALCSLTQLIKTQKKKPELMRQLTDPSLGLLLNIAQLIRKGDGYFFQGARINSIGLVRSIMDGSNERRLLVASDEFGLIAALLSVICEDPICGESAAGAILAISDFSDSSRLLWRPKYDALNALLEKISSSSRYPNSDSRSTIFYH